MPRQLLARAAAALLLLPGVVAYLVPWLLAPANAPAVSGLALVALGTLGLIWCAREFYRAGRGTLAPWDPPVTLVATGPYRWSRNPMYVAVLVILGGWAVAFQSWALAGYAGCVAVAFHLRILFHEEPRLARLHADAWARYRGRTRRWLGRHAARNVNVNDRT